MVQHVVQAKAYAKKQRRLQQPKEADQDQHA
jgi:hypothetical protein